MAWFYFGENITKEDPVNFSIEYTIDNKNDWPSIIRYEENNKVYAKAGTDINSIQELSSFLQKAGYKTITQEKPKDTNSEKYVWDGKTWIERSIAGNSGIVPADPGYTANTNHVGSENSSTRGTGLGTNPNP